MGEVSKHAVLSPSSADRWMVCSGSVKMCEGFENTSGKAAAEGTVAHGLGEEILNNPYDFVFFSGEVVQDGFTIYRGQDMLDFTKRYTDSVLTYKNMMEMCYDNVKFHVEVKLPLESITLEHGAEGTADCIIYSRDELQIHDFKYGRYFVDVEENRQLTIYALAAIEHYGINPSVVRLFIHQPRVNRHPREFVATREYLQAFKEEAKQKALVALSSKLNENLTPDVKACAFCKAKTFCKALEDYVADTVRSDIKYGEFGERDDYDIVLPRIELMKMWMNAIEEDAEQFVKNGGNIKGYKLVKTSTKTKFEDGDLAENKLKAFGLKDDVIFVRKLRTPLQIMKKLDDEMKEKVKELTKNQPTSLSLVKETDKRREFVVDMFEDF